VGVPIRTDVRMGREEVGRGMVERFYVVARQYGIKTEGERRRVLKFYVDVHRGMRSVEGFRITYSTDGKAFRHVDSFSGFRLGPETNYSWIRCLSSTRTA
jgi:hypothetical protein